MTTSLILTRRRLLTTGSVGLAGLAVSGCDVAGTRPLLSSDTHPSGYPTVEAVEFMGKYLHERTDGRLDIRVYAGGQLGSERDTLEITSFGGLDVNRVNLAPMNSIEPLTIIPSLPFLFRSTTHMRQSLDGEVGETILNSLEPHNLVGLCFYDSGERCFYNTKKPIYSPEDMHGMKMRVPGSDLYVAMTRALGADATPMPLSEAYQALVQGVIDGAENNWPSYDSGRHFEAAPYYSLTRHVMAPELLVMSLSRWRKLSDDDKVLVKEAAKASVPFMRSLWDVRVENSRTKLLAAGVKVNEVKDLSEFQRLMTPVWERFVKTPAQEELVAKVQRLSDELEGRS